MPPFLTQKARNRPNYYIRWNPELESVVRINYKNAAALQLLVFFYWAFHPTPVQLKDLSLVAVVVC